MRNETEVRHWLAGMKNFGCIVEWVEAGRGGTYGLADANLFLPSMIMIPIELKLWERNARCDGFKARLNKHQVRYHAVNAKANRPTLLLWGTRESDYVWFLPGHRAPKVVTSTVLLEARGLIAVQPWEKREFVQSLEFGIPWRDTDIMPRALSIA